MSSAIVFLCHGAREQAWREPFDQIVGEFRALRPEIRVELAFLEFMSPGLTQVLDAFATSGVNSIRVVLLFLAPGGHTRRDVGELLESARSRWPAVRIEVTETLTEAAAIRSAIIDWALKV